RAAIKRGDYQRAESLINDAEKLGVKYDPVVADRFSDTPDTLRKLLATERSRANAAKPGFRLPNLFGGNSRPASSAVPADPTASPQPRVNPQTATNAADQIAGDVKSRAVAYLKDARAALARRDNFAAL